MTLKYLYIILLCCLWMCDEVSGQPNTACLYKIDINTDKNNTHINLQTNCKLNDYDIAWVHIGVLHEQGIDSVIHKKIVLSKKDIDENLQLQLALADWQKKGISNHIETYQALPFGVYKISLTLLNAKDTIQFSDEIRPDSLLHKNHTLYKQVHALLNKKLSNAFFTTKMNMVFAKYGLSYHWKELNDNYKEVLLYDNEKFFGKLKFALNDHNQFAIIKNDIEQNINAFNFRKSILSLFTEMEEEQQNDTISGYLHILGNSSNQQELNADFQNTFYELEGNVNMELLGIPVNVQGYYTSQDKNRILKSSYFSLHYDKEKMAEKVQKVLQNYNEAGAKVKATDGIYKQYYHKLLQELYKEKDALIRNVKQSINDTVRQLYDHTRHPYDSAAQALGGSLSEQQQSMQHYQDSIQNTMQVVERKTEQLQHYQDSIQNTLQLVERKIEQLQQLIDKAEKLQAFDSVKMATTQKYKDMDRNDPSAAYAVIDVLYPDNHVTKTLKKLNSLNIGMIQDNISKHTNSGQLMSGLNIGYDFGLFDASLSAGKINNIDFNNHKKRYWVGALKLVSKEFLRQNIGLLYYTYQPNKDSTYVYNKETANKPSNQIIGGSYKLNLDNFVIDAEFSSLYYKNSQQQLLDHSAYFIQSGGKIWQDKIVLQAKYESIGKDFINETNVFNIKNIATLTTNAQFSLMRDFIKGNISYTLLQQQQHNQTGQNKKWGFELRTESKRFPKVLVAYKPFTTFKTISDSFALQPVNLFGNIKMLRLDYQYRYKKHMLKLVLNGQVQQNILDTIQYLNKNWNVSMHYQNSSHATYINIGRMALKSNMDFQNILLNNNTYYIIGYQTNIASTIATNISLNMAFDENVISKYGMSVFVNKSFKWTKAQLLIGGSWNYYKLLPQPQIYNVQLGFRLPFEFKR